MPIDREQVTRWSRPGSFLSSPGIHSPRPTHVSPTSKPLFPDARGSRPLCSQPLSCGPFPPTPTPPLCALLSLFRGDPCPGRWHQKGLNLSSPSVGHLVPNSSHRGVLVTAETPGRPRATRPRADGPQEAADRSQIRDSGLPKTGPDINSPGDIIVTPGDHPHTNEAGPSSSRAGGTGACWGAQGPPGRGVPLGGGKVSPHTWHTVTSSSWDTLVTPSRRGSYRTARG